jgi:16S rRNA (cytosine1402-N4)-methyltransferase
MSVMSHVTVLLQPSIEALALTEGMTVVDGTFGGGGHSLEIAKRIGRAGRLYSFDADSSVFDEKKVQELGRFTEFHPVRDNFRNAGEALKHLEIDAALLDLGLSSNQLEASGRGFSFQRDEPLLMTFGASPVQGDVTAGSVVNEWKEETIAAVLFGFGEERYAKSIARAIGKARVTKRIETTKELVDIVRSATPARYHHGKTHPATKTFQALRMAVNDELGAIEDGIRALFDRLRPGGRLAVISFHSVEDRKVKQLLRAYAGDGKGKQVTKKPIVPDDEELTANPRARSAKLRVIEKV